MGNKQGQLRNDKKHTKDENDEKTARHSPQDTQLGNTKAAAGVDCEDIVEAKENYEEEQQEEVVK